MKIHSTLYSLMATGCLLTSCTTVRQQAYYVSPFNGHPSDYHPLPVSVDSAHTAVYIHAAFLNGSANQRRTDGVTAFRSSISVAHHTGILQAYYGGDFTIGAYKMGKWDTGATYLPVRVSLPPANTEFLNSKSGSKTFGGVGFDAGANLVWPNGQCEWRYIGVETSMHQEFGDYLSIRKGLPDSAASLLIRNPFFATLGLSTEIVKRTSYGEFGFRFVKGWSLGNAYQNSGVYDKEAGKHLHYGYGSFSFHLTTGRYTAYIQFNGATQARSLNLGIHYRLTHVRTPEWKPHNFYKRDPSIWYHK